MLALGLLLAGCGAQAATVQGGNDTLHRDDADRLLDLPLLGGPRRAASTARRSIALRRRRLALYRRGRARRTAPRQLRARSTTPIRTPAPGPPTRPATRRTPASADHERGRPTSATSTPARPAISLPLNNENDVAPDQPGQPATSASPTRARRAARTSPASTTRDAAAHVRAAVPSDADEARAIVTLHALARRPAPLRARPTRADPLDADDRAARRRRRAAPAGIAVAGARPGSTRGAAARPPDDPRSSRARAPSPRATPTPCSSAAPANTGAAALWRDAARGAAGGAAVRAEHARGARRSWRARRRRASATYVTSPYLEPDQYPPAAQAGLRASTAACSRRRRRASTRSTATRRCAIVLAAIQPRRAGAAPNRASLLRRVLLARRDPRRASATSASTPHGDTSLDALRRLPRRRAAARSCWRALPIGLSGAARPARASSRSGLRERVAERERARRHRVLARGDDLRHLAVEQRAARAPGTGSDRRAVQRAAERARELGVGHRASGAVALNAPSKRSSSSAAR